MVLKNKISELIHNFALNIFSMDLDNFIRITEEEFNKTGKFSKDTPLSGIIEFSSLNVLIIITLIKSEFNIMLNIGTLRKCVTLGDLYEVVKLKKAEIFNISKEGLP